MQSEKNDKKILIYYSQFNIGGAEKSNLRLMNLLVKNGWDVTLLLRCGGGTMEDRLSKEVRVIYLAKTSYPALIAGEKHKVRRILKAIRYALPYCVQRIAFSGRLSALRKEKFNIAVVGLQGLNPDLIVNRISAEAKLLWIRNDMLHCDPDGHVSANIRKYGDRIDFFPCVSGTAFDSFCSTFPELKDKARLFYNVIDAGEMRRLGEEPCELEGRYIDALRMITVCRVSDKAKGVFRMLNVYQRLREDGVFFYWIVVGDGPDYEELYRRVREAGMDDGFILIGRRENPFPFYRYCDLSATFSYYEGLCGTINEAKIMGLPVLATEFSGIHEQIESGRNGWIFENSEDAIYNGMKELFSHPERIEAVKNAELPRAIADDGAKESLLWEMLREKRNSSEK